MNIAKTGLSTCTRYAKAYGEKSILQTVPQNLSKLDVAGLKYVPKLEGDVSELSASAKQNIEKIVDESNIYELLHRSTGHLYSSEREGLEEIILGKTESEAKKIISTIKDYKKNGRHLCWVDGTFNDEPTQTEKFIKFMMTDDKLDEELSRKAIKLLKEKPYLSNTIERISSLSGSTSEVKSKLIDLIKIMDDSVENRILKNDFFSDTQLAKVIRSFVDSKSTSQKQLERIKLLEKLTNDGFELDNFEKVLFIDDYKVQNLDLVEEFLKVSYPTKEISEIFREKPTEVINLLTKYKKKYGVNSIVIDKYEYELLSNKNPEIETLIAKECKNIEDLSDYDLTFVESALFPDMFKIELLHKNKNTAVILFFDKSTRKLKEREVFSQTGNRCLLKSEDYVNHTETEQIGTENVKLVSESKVVKNKQGKVLYTDKLVESSVEGQNDLYRIYPNGKIQVLSKAFRDPETGEIVIKKHLESLDKTRTEYYYRGLPDGSYTSSHKIIDKNGKELMNIDRSYKIVDDTHFVSTLNGKEYKITLDGNELYIKTPIYGVARINLDKLIPSKNQKLRNMIIHLPGDELDLMSNYSYVKYIKDDYIEMDNAIHIRDFHGHHIEIGKNILDKASVLSHEYGHSYVGCNNSMHEDIFEFVNPTYQKELKEYRKKASMAELRIMNYLVDNKSHYQNKVGKSAIEECFADANSLAVQPNDWDDTADRILKFQENFPETFAKITEFLRIL